MADSYQLKKKAIAEDRPKIIGGVVDTLKEIQEDVVHDSTALASAITNFFTPEFISRIKYRKIHQDIVNTSIEKYDALQNQIDNTVELEVEDNKKQQDRFKQVRKEVKRSKFQRELEKKVRLEVEAQKKEAITNEYLTRQRGIYEVKREELAAAKLAEETRHANELQAHRTHQEKFWREQVSSISTVLKARTAEDARRAEVNRTLTEDVLREEWEAREVARARLQAEWPLRDEEDLALSVFTERGVKPEDRRPGLDTADVHPFDASPVVAFEQQSQELLEAASRLARDEQLYEALQFELRQIPPAMKRIVELRELAERDFKQIANELSVMELSQLGPPRRLPTPIEVQTTHARKQRQNDLSESIDSFQNTLDSLDAKRRDLETQMMLLAKGLAVSRERHKQLSAELGAVNDELGHLPVVIGKGLSTSGLAGGETNDPMSIYDKITSKSRLAHIQEQEAAAMQQHHDRSALDQQLWVSRQEKTDVRQELDFTLSRLAAVSGRLKQAFSSSVKSSLLEALDAFFASGIRLRQVNTIAGGPVRWFHASSAVARENVIEAVALRETGCIYFEEQEVEEEKTSVTSVVLADACCEGHIQGTLRLPKMATWIVSFTITNDSQHNNEGMLASDFVAVRLGSSELTLSLVGTYHNRVNPETNAILYEVHYLLRGSSLAYRFEFSSATMDISKHLSVNDGVFNEYQMEPLEICTDPHHPGKLRVVSSYIKMLRVEENQGKLRLTRLLEELIRVDHSSSKTWDAAVLVTNSRQRYNRELFARILRAEILVEHRIHGKQLQSGIGADLLNEKLKLSMERFLTRKRRHQKEFIDKCMAEINKRVDVYDDKQQRWRNVKVLDCKLKWIDNGAVAQVTHVVQEYDDQNMKIGGEYECNLVNMRYFISAVQSFDESAKLSFMDQRQWEERIRGAEQRGQDTVAAAIDDLRVYKARKEDELRAMYAEEWRTVMEAERAEAEVYVNSPQAKSAINAEVDKVALEVRRGTLKLESPRNQQKQLLSIAKERIIGRYIKNRKKEFDNAFKSKVKFLESNLLERTKEIKALKATAAKSVNAEVALYNQAIKSKREALLARVKFDPVVFQAAVPKATSCEHVKSKAWGTFYGKGVRCVACNKELTRLHLEESQYLGYGSGTDPKVYDMVKRHRANEASFRFQSAAELRQVEEERLRLEKERRVMEENEIFFYDYETLMVIHDFDKRHNLNRKPGGGSKPLLLGNAPGDAAEGTEALDPAPTFRADDERRRAQYAEFLFIIGRIQIFHRKIEQLKDARLELMTDRAMLANVLEEHHKTSFHLDDEMGNLERDLNRTYELLSTKDSVINLWEEAKRVLKRALRDKRSAEMRLAGKWDDVKEASDALNFIHDDTRALLRIKFLTDLKLSTQSEEIEMLNDMAVEATNTFLENEKTAAFFLYCRPGNTVRTRYGEGVIRGYREEDGMLLVTLSYCKPSAKLWILAEEIVYEERARQQAEGMLMLQEEENMKLFVETERLNMKRELFAMRLEEAEMRKFSAEYRVTSKQQAAIESNVDLAVKKGMILLETPQYQAHEDKLIASESKAQYDQQLEEFRTYDGPPSGAPPKPTMFSMYTIRQSMHKELKERFLTELANRTCKAVTTQFEVAHRIRVEEDTINLIIESSIIDLIRLAAEESIKEGRQAKAETERASGLIIQNPTWMQFDTYCTLIELLKERRQAIRARLVIVRGALAKVDIFRRENPDPVEKAVEELAAEAEDLTAEAMRRAAELERQRVLCEEMAAEEDLSRKFYKWELLENLRERRQMKEEDLGMRALMKEEEAIAASKDQGYAVTSSMAEEQQKQYKLTSFDKRRLELKALTLERGKQAEELARMTLEDARSKLLQEVDKADRQRQMFEKEFGIIDEPELVEEENVDTEGGADGIIKFETVKVPAWMEIPAGWENWLLSQQKDYVKRAKTIRILTKRINKNLLIDRKRMEKYQAKSTLLWEELYLTASMNEMDAELKAMELSEAVKVSELEVQDLQRNQRKLFLICREKGEKEIKARSLLKKRQELARKYERELKEADDWLKLCVKSTDKKAKLKTKVEADVRFIDVDSINGFWQRIDTKSLQRALLEIYFQRILDSIISRAESIAVERHLLRVQESLTRNKVMIMERVRLMRELMSDVRRENYMRMKKSALNKIIFPRNRLNILKHIFGGWVRFFLWNRGHREAFELKYEVLKTRMDVDRKYKAAQDKEAGVVIERSQSAPTLMQRHRERPVQCRNCSVFYIESQNTSVVCRYHVGKFMFCCPKTCENPGKSQFCIVHKIRRWNCCDNTVETAVGCCQRYHVPVEFDPVYHQILEKIRERNTSTLEELNVKHEGVHHWVEKHDHIKKKHYAAIESELTENRERVNKFNTLKFV